MADLKLFLGLFIFVTLFNIILGLFAVNSPELTALEFPAPREITFTNFIGVFFDYIGFVFQVAIAGFSIMPWWLSFIFIGVNLTLILVLIDLIWPG